MPQQTKSHKSQTLIHILLKTQHKIHQAFDKSHHFGSPYDPMPSPDTPRGVQTAQDSPETPRGTPTSAKDLETFTNLSILSGAPAHPHPRSKIEGPRSEHQDSRSEVQGLKQGRQNPGKTPHHTTPHHLTQQHHTRPHSQTPLGNYMSHVPTSNKINDNT